MSASVAAARNAIQLAASSPTLFGMRLGIWQWQCPAPIPATLWPLIRLGWVLPALRHAAGATSLRASCSRACVESSTTCPRAFPWHRGLLTLFPLCPVCLCSFLLTGATRDIPSWICSVGSERQGCSQTIATIQSCSCSR